MTIAETRKALRSKVSHCNRELKRYQPAEVRKALEQWKRDSEAELAALPNGRKGFAATVHGRQVSTQGISA